MRMIKYMRVMMSHHNCYLLSPIWGVRCPFVLPLRLCRTLATAARTIRPATQRCFKRLEHITQLAALVQSCQGSWVVELGAAAWLAASNGGHILARAANSMDGYAC
jgi:hypothetical protein